MKAPRRLQLRLANASFVVLFVVVIGLLMGLTRTYHGQFDWTRSGRNTLAPASVALLEKLDQPVRLTAFASEQRGLQQSIREVIRRYQRHKPDFVLDFVDPDRDPARVREAGIQFDGEMIVEYAGNKETLSQLTEETLTNALARLARAGERWIVFLDGHGERRPDREANHDLSIWASQLEKRGLKTRRLLLNETPQIPEDTSVLVIADPQTRLLPGEVKQIEAYLERGGNLLWLAEPGGLRGLEPIAERLGLEVQPGVIVDPASQVVTGEDATFLLIARYGTHPAVRSLAAMTLFPTAAGIRLPGAEEGEASPWNTTVLLDTLPSAWAETGKLEGAVEFDAGRDVRGPLGIGVTLTREIDKREQRVTVIGDADFLSNTFLGNGGNLDLGMNLVNWASSDEAHIDLPARTATDLSLNLSRAQQTVIASGFLIVLPLFLFTTGIVVWWRRRRR